MKIKITCKGSAYIPIDQLLNFQGNLKKLENSEFEKLKRSIEKYGFSFPVFVWKNNILDGHQRIFVVRKMLEDGHTIDDIPVVEIEAKNKKEAAEKLLLLNSQYGKITDIGFDDFINDYDLDITNYDDLLNIPDIDLNTYWEENELEEDNSDIKSNVETNECPKCGYKWNEIQN